MKLTPEQIEQNVEAVRAWFEGNEIEWESSGLWFDQSADAISLRTDQLLRLKSQPNLRPWKPEEVLFNAFFKRKNDAWIFSVSCFRGDNVVLGNCGAITISELFNNFTHSIDGGKTWLPCGVMEESK